MPLGAWVCARVVGVPAFVRVFCSAGGFLFDSFLFWPLDEESVGHRTGNLRPAFQSKCFKLPAAYIVANIIYDKDETKKDNKLHSNTISNCHRWKRLLFADFCCPRRLAQKTAATALDT